MTRFARSRQDRRGRWEFRLAAADEMSCVTKLAALDSAPAPQFPVVLALADGECVAAQSLVDGGVVADPFRSTADILGPLAAAAQQLERAGVGPDAGAGSAPLRGGATP